jgi:hypothetical protein
VTAATTAVAIGGLALSAAGTGLSVMGQMNAQAAAGAQQAYLAQQSRMRAQILDQQANDALQRGDVAADRQRTVTAQRLGTQTAALAAQGTDLSGSPSDILSDTSKAGELDASTIRANAAREAWGYKAQEAGEDADAAFRSSYTPSSLGAGASLLMGASSLADKWSKFQFNAPYNLSTDYTRTANDADLAGYSGSPS